MQIRKSGKTMWLAAVLCAVPVVAMVPGCGGGGNGLNLPNAVTPNPAFVTDYFGSYRITAGPDSGDEGTIEFTVNSSGQIEGEVEVELEDSDSLDLEGVTTNSNGSFTLVGNDDDFRVTLTGQLVLNGNNVPSATGTFTTNNGNSGVFELTRD